MTSIFDRFNSETNSEKGFTPLFGTYCRTCAFEPAGIPEGEDSCHMEYREAYQSDAAKGLWNINMVATSFKEVGRKGARQRKKITETREIETNVPFEKAMHLLADFENVKRNASLGEHVEKGISAKELAWKHYFAFTVREGFIFDVLGRPYQRPSKYALPTGGSNRLDFDAEMLEEANAIWDKVAEQHEQPVPLPIMSQTLLYEVFNRASSQANFDDALNCREALNEMDDFFGHIESAHGRLKTYISSYLDMGKGQYISGDKDNDFEGALQYLAKAEKQLAKTENYIDTAQYIAYLKQCEITCHIIHIQGVADLNNKNIFQTEFGTHERHTSVDEQRKDNLSIIKTKRKSIQALYKTLGAGTGDLQDLDAAAAKTGGPEMPENLTKFIELYRERREEFKKKLDNNEVVSPQSLLPPTGDGDKPKKNVAAPKR